MSVAAQATPTIGSNPSADLAPQSGPPGTDVTATGSGWEPGTTVSVEFDTNQLGTVEVLTEGDFTFEFSVPDVEDGVHPVFFNGPSERYTTEFTVGTEPPPPDDPPPPDEACSNPPDDPFARLLRKESVEWRQQFWMTVCNSIHAEGLPWSVEDTGIVAISIMKIMGELFGVDPFDPSFPDTACSAATKIVLRDPGVICPFLEGYISAQSTPYQKDLANSLKKLTPPPAKVRVKPRGPHAIKVSWVDTSSNEKGFRISNGVVERTAGANSKRYIWSGLQPGTYMCFKTLAYNKSGASAWQPNAHPWYRCTTTTTN